MSSLVFNLWRTPRGVIVARVVERYTGMSGQPRVLLVDTTGRVHHYDELEVKPA